MYKLETIIPSVVDCSLSRSASASASASNIGNLSDTSSTRWSTQRLLGRRCGRTAYIHCLAGLRGSYTSGQQSQILPGGLSFATMGLIVRQIVQEF